MLRHGKDVGKGGRWTDFMGNMMVGDRIDKTLYKLEISDRKV